MILDTTANINKSQGFCLFSARASQFLLLKEIEHRTNVCYLHHYHLVFTFGTQGPLIADNLIIIFALVSIQCDGVLG